MSIQESIANKHGTPEEGKMNRQASRSDDESTGSHGGVNAVDRAMRILAAFTRQDVEMSLHELEIGRAHV